MDIFKFNLGDVLKCTVTGYTGTVICRNEWLNGCVQYCLKSKVDKDGKIQEGEWFDEGQLALKKAKPKPKPKPVRSGGPTSRTPSTCNKV